MKKWIFVLSLVLSFNAYAEIVTGEKCGDDCTWTLDTETGKLIISGTGNMYNWYEKGWATPWREYGADIQSIVIEGQKKDDNGNVVSGGITSIGSVAFANLTALKNIEIADSVTAIESLAFYQTTALESISIPDSVTQLSWGPFQCNTSLKEIIIPDGVTYIPPYCFAQSTALEAVIIGDQASVDYGAFEGVSGKIYCTSVSSCSGKGADDSQIETYTKDKTTDIYQTSDGLYFLSAQDMINASKAQSDEQRAMISCGTDMNVCKAELLKNKGMCVSDECDALVASANAGKLLKVGSKTYQSLDALLKGKYDKRRIYTIDEANLVAGDKNMVRIKYR